MYNFDLCNVLMAIATNIPVLNVTGFVLQGHTCCMEVLLLIIVLALFVV